MVKISIIILKLVVYASKEGISSEKTVDDIKEGNNLQKFKERSPVAEKSRSYLTSNSFDPNNTKEKDISSQVNYYVTLPRKIKKQIKKKVMRDRWSSNYSLNTEATKEQEKFGLNGTFHSILPEEQGEDTLKGDYTMYCTLPRSKKTVSKNADISSKNNFESKIRKDCNETQLITENVAFKDKLWARSSIIRKLKGWNLKKCPNNNSCDNGKAPNLRNKDLQEAPAKASLHSLELNETLENEYETLPWERRREHKTYPFANRPLPPAPPTSQDYLYENIRSDFLKFDKNSLEPNSGYMVTKPLPSDTLTIQPEMNKEDSMEDSLN